MKKLIFILVSIILFLNSCSIYRGYWKIYERIFFECSYEEIKDIDESIRFVIDNIDSIDNLEKEYETTYYNGDYWISYHPKKYLIKYFSNKNYELCLHRVYKGGNCNFNRGTIVYRSLISKYKLQTNIIFRCDTIWRISFHYYNHPSCKFWKRLPQDTNELP